MNSKGDYLQIIFFKFKLFENLNSFCKTDISMPTKEWRARMYNHHSLYAKGATWASAYELHLRDPTIVLYKAIYKQLRASDNRRTLMARCHIFPGKVMVYYLK